MTGSDDTDDAKEQMPMSMSIYVAAETTSTPIQLELEPSAEMVSKCSGRDSVRNGARCPSS